MKTSKKFLRILAFLLVSLIAFIALAGDLTPSAPPGPTMKTLDEIYNITESMRQPIGPLAAAAKKKKAYVYLEQIPGESTHPYHEDWIEALWVNSEIVFQYDPITGGHTTSRPTFSDIVFVKEIDKASPLLYEKCCFGQPISSATIDFIKSVPGNENAIYMQYELQNVLVTKTAPVMSHLRYGENDYTHLEQINISFEKIRWKYTIYSPDGSSQGYVERGWDVRQNQPW